MTRFGRIPAYTYVKFGGIGGPRAKTLGVALWLWSAVWAHAQDTRFFADHVGIYHWRGTKADGIASGIHDVLAMNGSIVRFALSPRMDIDYNLGANCIAGFRLDAALEHDGLEFCNKIGRPGPRGEYRRHIRKYAQGELEEEGVFYFRGPAGKLNLRAANLTTFLTMAQGVDEENLAFSPAPRRILRVGAQGDQRRGNGRCVKAVEEDRSLTPAETRDRIRRRSKASTRRPRNQFSL